MNPEDAARLGLGDGNTASVASRSGSLEIPIEITDAIMPGVVSIPHGWGHTLSRTKTRIASEHAGVNTNILTDEVEVDPLSGNAVLNGIPVAVEKVLT
jgi:anaerobic selenocysteine-containing dehydrogenase